MRLLPVAGCLLPVLFACASKPDAPPPAAPKTDPQIAALQTSMTELLERLDVMNDRIAKLEKANEEPAPQPRVPARPAETPASQPKASPLRSADIANLYRTAIAQYGQGHLAEARNAFQRVFDSDPSGDLADNALFWMGETYYSAGNYNEAIRCFKRVADEYSDQNKAPDALYMLALAYEKTSDLALARTTLQQVIARYPYSAPAASAKSELNRIKY